MVQECGQGFGLFVGSVQFGGFCTWQGHNQGAPLGDLEPAPFCQRPHGSLAAVGQLAEFRQCEGGGRPATQGKENVCLFGGMSQAGQSRFDGGVVGQQADILYARRGRLGWNQGEAGLQQALVGQGIDDGFGVVCTHLAQQGTELNRALAFVKQLQGRGFLGSQLLMGGRGLADDEGCPRFEARRKHEPNGLTQGRKVGAGDPAGQLDLDRGDNRERIEDFGDVEYLESRRQARRQRIAQVGNDAQGGAVAQRDLDEMADLCHFPQALRQPVGKGHQPRGIASQRLACAGGLLLDGPVYDDVCIHWTKYRVGSWEPGGS